MPQASDKMSRAPPHMCAASQTSESEVLSNSARGMSQSPHFSFSPLDPGTRIAGCGSQSTHTNYKTTNYKTCNGLSTAEHSSEGAGRNANGVGHGGPQTTTTMPTGTKRGFKGSEQGHGAERAKRVKISATSSGANVEVPPADAPQVECAISVSSVSSSAHECPVGYQVRRPCVLACLRACVLRRACERMKAESVAGTCLRAGMQAFKHACAHPITLFPRTHLCEIACLAGRRAVTS